MSGRRIAASAAGVGAAAGRLETWFPVSRSIVGRPVWNLPPLICNQQAAIGSTVFSVAVRQIRSATLHAPQPGAEEPNPAASQQGHVAHLPRTSSMEEAVSEQREVLFPRARDLERAWQENDPGHSRVAVTTREPEPTRRLPYRTYDKDGPVENESDEEPDLEHEVDTGATRTAATLAPPSAAPPAGGEPETLEEVGFRYSGPEPTLYGDWAHKGRVTDF